MPLFFDTSDCPGHIINLRLARAAYDALARCPCCGSKANVQLSNTHTSSYSMECEVCLLELHDNGRRSGYGKTMAAHRASARRVLRRWNDMGVYLGSRDRRTYSPAELGREAALP